MKTIVFSARAYDREALERANAGAHELTFVESALDAQTARLAAGHEAACLFVNDVANADVLSALAGHGVRAIAQRATGYNNIDLKAAEALGMTVMRVGYYSPYAVAEHAVALLQAVNRKTHRAYNRTRDNNFLLDGLVGVDLHGKTVGVVGTGKIGEAFARIMTGFGCTVLGYDVRENPACVALGVRYVALDELAASADVVSLHVPLFPETMHLVGASFLARMKHDALLVNTSRGKLVDTDALVDVLKSGKLAGVGLDVYEVEEKLFFRDLSQRVVLDDLFIRLSAFPNVIITAHQAFLTREALGQIAATTIQNLTDAARGVTNGNVVRSAS
jgi:D-lactate dehydrogenase